MVKMKKPVDETKALTWDQHFWRGKILFATYFGYAGFYLTRKVFTICKGSLAKPIEEGGFGMGIDVANIWTAFLVAYMLGQFLNSFIGRKWGSRVLLLGGLGLSIAFNIVFGFANSSTTFLVFMFFNGLVQAAGWPGSVGGVAEWLRKKERGTIMGFWSTSYVLGNIIVKTMGGFLLAKYSADYDIYIGVRYSFLGCTLAAFAIWWLIFFWQRNKPQDVGLKPIVDLEGQDDRSVSASVAEHVTFRQYLDLLLNPVVPLMGCCYFCIKFLRYALDSWLPMFLDLQGMEVDQAAYYSSISDMAGLAGAILAGIALDRLFKGRWENLCLLMGIGTVIGYIAVVKSGANPYALAWSFGLVGFMLYGPDTLLCGTGAVIVAGERNAVAVAGIVNGMGSIGPIVQEQAIKWMMGDRESAEAVHAASMLGLYISILAVVFMVCIAGWAMVIRRRNLASASE